ATGAITRHPAGAPSTARRNVAWVERSETREGRKARSTAPVFLGACHRAGPVGPIQATACPLLGSARETAGRCQALLQRPPGANRPQWGRRTQLILRVSNCGTSASPCASV